MTFIVPIVAAEPELQAGAAMLAERLKLPLHQAETEQAPFVLELTRDGLQLRWTTQPKMQPLTLDYTRGAQAWRQKLGGGKQEAVVRAIGLGHNVRPSVLDATAGLGRDGMMLAHAGCNVYFLERHPGVHALLDHAIHQFQEAHAAEHWSSKRLHMLPAGSLLEASPLPNHIQSIQPDAIYLDPMFPEREKSAAVKKDMQFLQALVGPDLDADGLLAVALNLATYRVVVKRPNKAPFLAGQTPSAQVPSKKHRFDIYIKKAYPKQAV